MYLQKNIQTCWLVLHLIIINLSWPHNAAWQTYYISLFHLLWLSRTAILYFLLSPQISETFSFIFFLGWWLSFLFTLRKWKQSLLTPHISTTISPYLSAFVPIYLLHFLLLPVDKVSDSYLTLAPPLNTRSYLFSFIQGHCFSNSPISLCTIIFHLTCYFSQLWKK